MKRFKQKTNAELAVEIKAGKSKIQKIDKAIRELKSQKNLEKQRVNHLVDSLAEKLDPRLRKQSQSSLHVRKREKRNDNRYIA